MDENRNCIIYTLKICGNSEFYSLFHGKVARIFFFETIVTRSIPVQAAYFFFNRSYGFISETILPNKGTFYRKHIWKVVIRFPRFIQIGQKT
jgi:hypothetical protein